MGTVGLDLFVGIAALVLARRSPARPRVAPVGAAPAIPAAPEFPAAPEIPAVPDASARPAVGEPTAVPTPVEPAPAAVRPREPSELPHGAVWLVAFASGFATLAVEVVWPACSPRCCRTRPTPTPWC